MSGRWREQQTPFSCVLDLVQAIETLDSEDIQVMEMPQVLLDLKASEQRLSQLSEQLAVAVQGLDTESLGITADLLDAMDSELTAYKDSMERASSSASEDLSKLTSLMDVYQKEELAFQRLLDHSVNIQSINVNTPDGVRTLQQQHGRFRYRYRDDGYNHNHGSLGWLNAITAAYDEVGEQRREALRTTVEGKSSEIHRVQLSLKNRVASAREASARVAREELRRSRDKEINNLAKKHGMRVTRKKVGKKVQYALVRQR